MNLDRRKKEYKHKTNTTVNITVYTDVPFA